MQNENFTPVYLDRDAKTGELSKVIPTGFSPCSLAEAKILQSKLTLGAVPQSQTERGG